MRKRRLIIGLLILISFLPFWHLLLSPAANYLSYYLSKSEKVKANILIIEDRLPLTSLKMAYDEFQKDGYEYIITTVIKSSVKYFMLSENGYLIFYPSGKNSLRNEVRQHIIEVDAYSSLDKEHSAHFNFFLNDSLIVEFIADRHRRRYSFNWEGPLSEIDSLMIQFTNDGVGEYGDSNLFIKGIIIDHKKIIPYLNNSQYDIAELDGKRRITNNQGSFRNYLLLDHSEPLLLNMMNTKIDLQQIRFYKRYIVLNEILFDYDKLLNISFQFV